MNNNSRIFAMVLAGLVVLPGCIRVPSYKPKSLQSISGDFTYRSIEKGVVLQAKCLTEDQVYFLFGDRAKELLESVEVIHISVHNLSTEQYVISPDAMSIIQISYSDTLRSIQTRSTDHLKKAGKVGGAVYGTLSGLSVTWLLLLPQLIGGVDKFGMGIALTVGTLGVLWPIVAILPTLPFIGQAIKSAIMNDRINKDLKQKMLHTDIAIESGDKYEGLIFVKAEDYRSDFTVTLHSNNPNNKIVFDVDLSLTGYLIH